MNTDICYRIESLGWVALAILVPLAVYRRLVTFASNVKRHPLMAQVGARLTTFATIVVFSPIALAISLCNGPAPGDSDEARQFKSDLSHAVTALEQYRNVTGSYPATLEMLVPRYAAPSDLHREGMRPEYPLTYERTKSGYTLEFRYTGPGMNECTYTPQTEWRCGGRF